MNGLLAFFSPGPMELLIILVLVGVPLAAAGLVLLFVVLRSQKNPAASNPNLAPCPDCGNCVSHQAPACPKCGRPLLPKQNS